MLEPVIHIPRPLIWVTCCSNHGKWVLGIQIPVPEEQPAVSALKGWAKPPDPPGSLRWPMRCWESSGYYLSRAPYVVPAWWSVPSCAFHLLSSLGFGLSYPMYQWVHWTCRSGIQVGCKFMTVTYLCLQLPRLKSFLLILSVWNSMWVADCCREFSVLKKLSFCSLIDLPTHSTCFLSLTWVRLDSLEFASV